MSNIAWAQSILNELAKAGVDEIVLCPGARNAPFIEVLAHWENARLHSFFEERSAGFFALGRIAATHKPKAVITTSGTAVANLLPAVIEAHYAGWPLVVVSADRPKSFRGTGSPQTIVQPGIFTGYADSIGDWERGEVQEIRLSRHAPSHLNVCFDEPLIDERVNSWRMPESRMAERQEPVVDLSALKKFQERVKCPLILVGGVPSPRRALVLEWLKKQKAPIYLEGTSGLRGALPSLELHAAEKTAKLTAFDGVIRVGQVPTLRLWRDLEKSNAPVISISDLPFSGLARTDTEVLPFSSSLSEMVFSHAAKDEVLQQDREQAQKLKKLFDEFPLSEPALVRELSLQMHAEDSVYLGNSLPIREWDLAATRDVCFERCFGNRGVNGIDGQISSFLGWADETSRNWAVLGDLTALYDLSAPWALRSRKLSDVRIVIINNGGGQIFAPMFHQPLFENRHQTSFANWAAMWKLPHRTWQGEAPLEHGVTEVLPNPEQTQAFRSAW